MMRIFIKAMSLYAAVLKNSLKLIYAASPKYFSGYMVISILLVLISYVPMLLWRKLLNVLTAYIGGDNAPLIETIVLFTVLYCSVLLLQNILNTVITKVSYKYNDEIAYYVDNLLVDKISGAPMSFFDSSKLADNLMNTTRYMRGTLQTMVLSVFNMLKGFLKIAMSLVLICGLDIRLIPFLILISVPTVLFDRKAKSERYLFNKEHHNSERKLDYYKGLFFGGARGEIKIYDLAPYLEDKYNTEWEALQKAQLKLNVRQYVRTALSLILIAGAEAVTYIFAVSKLVSRKIGVGDVTFYISIAAKFRGDFINIIGSINDFRQQSAQLDDMMTFMNMSSESAQSGELPKPQMPQIEFRNVSFRYPGSDTYVLKNCNFTISPGETVGLVGLNGAGKSTIVKLLLRFYQPTEGNILFNGTDAGQYDTLELRGCFGVLFQNFCKYSFSLRENIAIADITRLQNDREILCACEESRAKEFIDGWERGIDEEMTKRFHKSGKELSGGQWQRVSLARAFFRNASVLLLDEPSSALDPMAEHEIFDRISRLSEKRSALLISHRLSNITMTDRILVLENGCIIEQGTHEELLKSDGRYAYLFNLQAGKYL